MALDTTGLFIEPGITYEMGKGDINWPSPLSDSTTETTGLGLSARLGFHIYESVFIGVDGRYAQPRFKNSAGDNTVDATSYNYGPVVGMQMPVVGLRVWGSYIFDGELDPKAYNAGGSQLDGKFGDGAGYRIGAGFRVAAISVNLEYQALKYDNLSVQQAGPFSPGTAFNSVSLEEESWILGLSFPLEL